MRLDESDEFPDLLRYSLGPPNSGSPRAIRLTRISLIFKKAAPVFDIPVLRFGQVYESMEKQPVVDFDTGEELARLHQATGAMVKLDLKKSQKARDALRAIPIAKLIEICKSAAEFYLNDTLPMGSGSLSPAEFCRMQSATTGLPEHMCATNMRKNAFVLSHMDEVLDALTRGLPYEVLERGYGKESRGVMVSYQANSPVFGMVLPNNSPGVHTLWLPALPMQIGLCIKPGSQEFWTPYRITEAFYKAGLPREAISIYPGGHDVGGAVMTDCQRAMIFGGQATVDQHAGNPKISVHGPGFSKIVLGDDVVDRWEDYLDLMVDSIFLNSGRSCISASGVWASRHSRGGAEIRRRDCRRARTTSRPDRAAPAERSEVATCRLHDGGCCRRDERPDRRRLSGRWCDRNDGEISRRRSSREAGPLRLPAADDYSLLRPRRAAREHRIHVPVRLGCRVPPEQNLGRDEADAGLHGSHGRREVQATVARRDEHRPAEHRHGEDAATQLAATARREHRGLPLPRASLPRQPAASALKWLTQKPGLAGC